jgi:signal transduction histidine kinase
VVFSPPRAVPGLDDNEGMDTDTWARMGKRTWITCVRGLSRAVLAPLAGIPLFAATLACLVTLPVGIGLWLAPKSLLAAREMAVRQRRRALEWSGVQIASPYRPRPAAPGLIGRMLRFKWLFTDPATWRDLLWTLVSAPAGAVLAAPGVALCWSAFAFLSGKWLDAWQFPRVLVLMAALSVASVAGGPLLLKLHAQFSALLLAPTRKAIQAQINHLTESRSDVVDSSAAELRRIERDLHDGAQARLVSLGMSIGLAEQMVKDNPDLALELLAEARAASGQALAELRSLVRGIHPPVLAERGLTGAVSALALTLPIQVDLHIDLDGRPSPPMESAAYFAIAEALANVAKHSGADRAWVQLDYDDGKLVAIVGDNGAGGATARPGGGLGGIERRLAAFDGVLAVTSPAGGPTVVTMELPCELSLART